MNKDEFDLFEWWRERRVRVGDRVRRTLIVLDSLHDEKVAEQQMADNERRGAVCELKGNQATVIWDGDGPIEVVDALFLEVLDPVSEIARLA